jgi:hypothetical protein
MLDPSGQKSRIVCFIFEPLTGRWECAFGFAKWTQKPAAPR